MKKHDTTPEQKRNIFLEENKKAIANAPRLSAAWALTMNSYANEDLSDPIASAFLKNKLLGFKPVKLPGFDANGFHSNFDASMLVSEKKGANDPWKSKNVISVAFRGTCNTETVIKADTSFSRSNDHYRNLFGGTTMAVNHLLESSNTDVIAIDGHSLGGFCSGEFLADLVEAAQKKWKKDPTALKEFLGKIDFATFNPIGFSSRGIEAMHCVVQAGGQVKEFSNPADTLRTTPQELSEFSHARSLGLDPEEYFRNKFHQGPKEFLVELNAGMENGNDPHRLKVNEEFVRDVMSIYLEKSNTVKLAEIDFASSLERMRGDKPDPVFISRPQYQA